MHSDTSLSPIKIDLGATRSYHYTIESLQRVPHLMAEAGLRVGKCIVVTDATVAELYATTLDEALGAAGWQPERIVVIAC